ncbi:MAG: hypothetical protein QF464_02660 [Myxococcota bacterium]|jgi:hypothetical protein|nr:hypothetical protein [Myxococcota bacterium]
MSDRAGTGLTRSELLAVALSAVLLLAVARGYHPTYPTGTNFLRACFAGLALWAVFRLVRPGRLGRRWRLLLGVPAVLVLTGAIAMMVAMGWIVLQIRLPQIALPLLTVQAIAVIGALVWAWRVEGVRRWVGRWLGVAIVVNTLGYMGLAAWIWAAPSAESCAPVAGPGVTRLTPQSYPDAHSVPFEVLYVPEEKKVVGTFKMAGNNVIDLWDDPDANRLVVVDVSDPSRPVLGDLPLSGELLPEHMDYSPTQREIVLNRVGYGSHSLDFVSLADFPALTLRHRRALDFPPHGVVTFTDHRSVGVFGVNMQFEAVEAETGEPQSRRQYPYGGPTVMVAYISRPRDTDVVYISTWGQMVTELNLVTGERRVVRVPFGGGDILFVPEMKRVYLTDLMFRRLHILDSRSMRLDRTISLDFQPRAIAVDYARDLLMIGAWFTGDVHFYRLRTLEPVGDPVGLGPYLRKVSYDTERSLLYGASSCGLYQLDVATRPGVLGPRERAP